MARRQGKKQIDLRDPQYFIDRELSWLKFNERVVEEAEDPSTPLLDRLKFLGIASSNLDEFFMVRVSGIQEQLSAQVRLRTAAGYTPEEQFNHIHEAAHLQLERIYSVYQDQVYSALAEEGIVHVSTESLSRNQRRFLKDFFHREVFPALTPLAVDSGHPFPHLRNLSLNLAVLLQPPRNYRFSIADTLFAIVQVPSVIDRIVALPNRRENIFEYILLEEVIASELNLLFPGMKVKEICSFRVTRDADIEFAEEEADDLLKTIEEELRGRERGSAVRIDIAATAGEAILAELLEATGLEERHVYRLNGPIDLAEVARIASRIDRSELSEPSFVPALREPLRTEKVVVRAVSRKDILLHHPYEAFSPVVDFIEQAAQDPNVLAIKQTLYRTSGDSAIVKALMTAAENGKQVAALMELKARFDEERNIGWARQMEKAGVHVVYGLVGLKTHAKVCLVVRREAGGIRRYVHLGTGNYNPNTARLYTDLGLLTCDPELCDDATALFNLLTGYSRMPDWKKMIVAPINMREVFIEMIEEEKPKKSNGRILAKMNSLVDMEIITKLYEASRAGVTIDLVVRGICCLRPGIPGVSENIRVSSIVDRFLEHSRLFVFGQGPAQKVYLSSADWMPRNLNRRVECAFPIESPELKNRVVEEILGLALQDNVKRRELQPDGNYVRVQMPQGATPLRSQVALLSLEAGLREETKAAQDSPQEMLGTPVTPPNLDLPISVPPEAPTQKVEENGKLPKSRKPAEKKKGKKKATTGGGSE
ncbi:MAG: polyphosphate kinase 1 [Candidatus Sumerlaeia bacterium]|nr:polyphosphate kinase 1 [Candidatus Sumerlaeia bacterium]